MVFIPLVIVIAAEFSLRVFQYGQNLDLFIPHREIDGHLIANPSVSLRYFSQQGHTSFGSDDVFSNKKQENTLRIFVFGGSTTAGFPYFFNGTFPGFLNDRLRYVFPEYDIELVNLGMTAVNSYTVRDLFRESLAHEPDLLVLYTGHNEFYGAMGPGSAEQSIFGTNRSLTLGYLQLKQLKLYQLIQNLISSLSKRIVTDDNQDTATLMARMARDHAIPYDSAIYHKTLDIFQANLSDIIRWAQKKKVPVLLGTVVSNLKDHQPFVSIHAKGVDEHYYAGEIEHARELMNSNKYSQALDILNNLIEVDPIYAMTYYYAGQCAEGLGVYEQARSYYSKARDYDALRFRASGDINEIIMRLGSQEGVYLTRVEEALGKASPRGLIGNDLMLEHAHPNLEGYFLIAKALSETILDQNLLSIATGRKLPPPNLSQSDDDFRRVIAVTPLDLKAAEYRIETLLSGWPFKDHRRFKTLSDFKPETKLEEVALDLLKKKLTYWRAHVNMIDYYDSLGKVESSMAECRALIKAFPKNWKSYRLMARTLIVAKRLDEALPFLIKVTEMSDDPFSHKWAGIILLEKKNHGDAIPFLIKSLSLKTDDHQARYNLAVAYHFSGQMDKAIKELERVLKDNPDFPNAREFYDRIRAVK
jgi:tetratricopeptide (TPR) repeat protein